MGVPILPFAPTRWAIVCWSRTLSSSSSSSSLEDNDDDGKEGGWMCFLVWTMIIG